MAAASLIPGGRIRRIPIADCVHYCGFHYGRGHFNPYENYITGLARGVPVDELRAAFADFIRHYRPADLGQALGVVTERTVPLWHLPWKSWRKLFRPQGWCDSLDDVVDILTHFSGQGVLQSRIDEEYGWLEGAWRSISESGYQPEAHSYITVFELRSGSSKRYMVIDGNHRISALAALGVTDVLVFQPAWSGARRELAPFWPLVLSRHVGRRDALAIFDAYFDGNITPHRSQTSATIVHDR